MMWWLHKLLENRNWDRSGFSGPAETSEGRACRYIS